jgi:uncharacterized protein (DUF488 family)
MPKAPRIPANPILTIGHSTRSLEELIAMLRAHAVTRLVDIRTIPRSRHNPQFNREGLETDLPRAGISYEHRKGLGGLRRPRKESRNTGWRNDGFRGFADYMESAEFEAELASLIAGAENERVAIMCAEAVPWRCHRSLVADALGARGIAVEHIMAADKCEPHKPTPFARIEAERVTYPPAQDKLM